MNPTPVSTSDALSPQTWAVLMAMLLIDSFHLIFGRLLTNMMSPFVSALSVLTVATVEVGLFLAWRRTIDWRVFWRHRWFFLAIGVLVATSTVMNYTAVTLIDAGTASLLGRFATVVTLALSYFWLKESLSRQEMFGAMLCIAGAIVISFQPGDVFRTGSLLVIGALTCYSLHIAIVKRYGDNIDFGNFFLYRVATTAMFLAMFTLASGNAALPPSGRAWLILLLAGTVDVVISRLLYYWALRQMRLGIHTILLTMTPVLTILWSILFFDESPTLQGLLGGAIVMAGIVLVAVAQQRRAR
jgi:drug/metabolite transporter (DMT)-like permease